MRTTVSYTPREIAEIASLYHNILEYESVLDSFLDPLAGAFTDGLNRRVSGAAQVLTRVFLPSYRELPQEVRDELGIGAEVLERKAQELLETISEESVTIGS